MNISKSLDSILEEYANRIGSPWGEGATYEPDRPERARKEGLHNPSHLSEEAKAAFKKDLSEAIVEAVEGLAKKNVTMLVPGIGKVIELDDFLQAIKEWQ